jgi:hypothetical protein
MVHINPILANNISVLIQQITECASSSLGLARWHRSEAKWFSENLFGMKGGAAWLRFTEGPDRISAILLQRSDV